MQAYYIASLMLTLLASQVSSEKLFLHESLRVSFLCPKLNDIQTHFSAGANGSFFSIKGYMCKTGSCWTTPSFTINLTDTTGDYVVTFVARHMDYIRQLTTLLCIYDGRVLKKYEASIFSRPQGNICYPPSLTDFSVKLVCYTDKVYPSAIWKYFFKDGITEVPGVVSYKSKSQTINGLRYTSVNSTFESPLTGFNEGTYEFTAVVSPGRTDNARFHEVVHVPSSVKLELPRMAFLQKCYRSRGKTGAASRNSVECMCFLERTGNPIGKLVWLNGVGHQTGDILNQYAVMLYLNLTNKVETYTCRLTSPLKNFTSSVSISISIKNLTGTPSTSGAPMLKEDLTDLFVCYIIAAFLSFLTIFTGLWPMT